MLPKNPFGFFICPHTPCFFHSMILNAINWMVWMVLHGIRWYCMVSDGIAWYWMVLQNWTVNTKGCKLYFTVDQIRVGWLNSWIDLVPLFPPPWKERFVMNKTNADLPHIQNWLTSFSYTGCWHTPSPPSKVEGWEAKKRLTKNQLKPEDPQFMFDAAF